MPRTGWSRSGRVPADPADRFWSKVDRSGDGCWEWTAKSRSTFGYGSFYRGSDALTPTMILAHRFSWQLAFGPIPDGLLVLHHCDNPPCVRPDHLFLGTQADNLADMASKGRSTRGRRWRQRVRVGLG